MVFGIVVAALGFGLLLKTQPFVSYGDSLLATFALCVLMWHMCAGLLIRTQDLLPQGGSVAGKDERFGRHAVGMLVVVLVWGVPALAVLTTAVEAFYGAWGRLVEDHVGTPVADELRRAHLWQRLALMCRGLPRAQTPATDAVAGQGGGASDSILANPMLSTGTGSASKPLTAVRVRVPQPPGGTQPPLALLAARCVERCDVR